MNCDEFEVLGLELNQSGADADQRTAAQEHLRACSRCAALVESWEEARTELFLLGEATSEAQTPPRVEMRLRQEFRARRPRAAYGRRAAWIVAWAAAVALIIAVGMNWRNWIANRNQKPAVPSVATNDSPANAQSGEVLVADSDGGAFTLLPGTLPVETNDASVMQVRMQRGALGALGLPVDQESASDWIRVDLLVGEDGIPEAVRLHQDTTQVATAQ